MIYIVFVLSFSAANLLFYTVQDGTMYWMLLTEAQRIGHAILVSRLVLNVRSCANVEFKEEAHFQSMNQFVHRPQQIDFEVIQEASTSAIDFAAWEKTEGVNEAGGSLYRRVSQAGPVQCVHPLDWGV